MVADAVDEDCLRALQALRRQGVEAVLAVVSRVDDAGLLAAVEADVVSTGLLLDERTSTPADDG